eukprot:PhF_6_TR36055/c0_g1_i2/m.52321
MDDYVKALTAIPIDLMSRVHHMDISSLHFFFRMKVDVPLFDEQAKALAELSHAGLNHCQATEECKAEHRTVLAHLNRIIVQFQQVLAKYCLKKILTGHPEVWTWEPLWVIVFTAIQFRRHVLSKKLVKPGVKGYAQRTVGEVEEMMKKTCPALHKDGMHALVKGIMKTFLDEDKNQKRSRSS